MNGLKCVVALIARHVELNSSGCRHFDRVRVSGDLVVVERRREVVKGRN